MEASEVVSTKRNDSSSGTKARAKTKRLSIEDFVHLCDHPDQRDSLTKDQLNDVIRLHGLSLRNRSNKRKAEISVAVAAIELTKTARTTIIEIVSPSDPLEINEIRRDLDSLGWQECPVASIMGIRPPNALEETTTIACSVNTVYSSDSAITSELQASEVQSTNKRKRSNKDQVEESQSTSFKKKRKKSNKDQVEESLSTSFNEKRQKSDDDQVEESQSTSFKKKRKKSYKDQVEESLSTRFNEKRKKSNKDLTEESLSTSFNEKRKKSNDDQGEESLSTSFNEKRKKSNDDQGEESLSTIFNEKIKKSNDDQGEESLSTSFNEKIKKSNDDQGEESQSASFNEKGKKSNTDHEEESQSTNLNENKESVMYRPLQIYSWRSAYHSGWTETI
ncbi:uncharacterized protein LOC144706674 [Wolffia australiana]